MTIQTTYHVHTASGPVVVDHATDAEYLSRVCNARVTAVTEGQ